MSKVLDLSEFSEISSKEWKQKIQAELKGADYGQTLLWESLEGMHVKPFYHFDEEKSTSLSLSRSVSDWKIVDTFFTKNEKLAHKNIRKSIENGSTGIRLQADAPFNFEKLFNNLSHQGISFYADFHFFDLNFFQSLLLFSNQNKIHFFLNFDPVGRLVTNGNWFENEKNDFQHLLDLLDLFPENQLLSIDSISYQQAGANIVQQLAYALAHLNEYFNSCAERIKKPVCIQFAIGGNYFFEIAKLRAFRRLYALLANEYQLEAECHLFAIPSKRNKTIYDYNMNMLRTTTECMSAVLGSADAVCNLPYDALYQKENEFGHRMARNQLLILKNESFFDAVENPADGAYYIESITRQLAEKALQLFKEIEQSGGLIKQLKLGIPQKKIEESNQKELALYLGQQEILVGTTKYIQTEDRMQENLELYPFLKTNPRKTLIKPILSKRISENIEKERLKSEI